MARNRETKIELTAYDDLFQTDESREEAKLSKIRDIPISQIDEFPDHPFKVLMNEDMEQLVDSVKRNGVMTPATVRLKEDGRYELMVTPTSDTTFDWYVNLNGTADVKATFTAEGRKKSCIIKLEEIEKISSLHRKENEDNAHLIKNPIVFTFLHRLLSRMAGTKELPEVC